MTDVNVIYARLLLSFTKLLLSFVIFNSKLVLAPCSSWLACFMIYRANESVTPSSYHAHEKPAASQQKLPFFPPLKYQLLLCHIGKAKLQRRRQSPQQLPLSVLIMPIRGQARSQKSSLVIDEDVLMNQFPSSPASLLKIKMAWQVMEQQLKRSLSLLATSSCRCLRQA